MKTPKRSSGTYSKSAHTRQDDAMTTPLTPKPVREMMSRSELPIHPLSYPQEGSDGTPKYVIQNGKLPLPSPSSLPRKRSRK